MNDLDSRFWGYCRVRDQWTPKSHLPSAGHAWTFCRINNVWADEIRIVDDGDHTIMHIMGGRLIYPTPAQGVEPLSYGMMQHLLNHDIEVN